MSKHTGLTIEIIGFLLTLVEIYLPDASEKMESFIDTAAYRARAYRSWSVAKLGRFLANMAVVIIIVFVAFSGLMLTFESADTLPSITFLAPIVTDITGILVYLIILIIIFISSLTLLLEYFIHFLNLITGGKALGTIGLALALYGLIGNVLQ